MTSKSTMSKQFSKKPVIAKEIDPIIAPESHLAIL
jgi:hypothetical protein